MHKKCSLQIRSTKKPVTFFKMVVKIVFIRDCSLFIGSTGPVFCGKDLWKMFLSRQQKSPKKLVSRQWKEGKSPCPV